MSNIITEIDNYGLPFMGNFLLSVTIDGKILYPQNASQSMGGQTVLRNLSITESIFTPIISGTVHILDVDNMGNNYTNSNITVVFTQNLNQNKTGKIVTFKGLITKSSVITDDAVLNSRMSGDASYKSVLLNFINEDIFKANAKTYQTKENPLFSGFIGWIADDGKRAQ